MRANKKFLRGKSEMRALIIVGLLFSVSPAFCAESEAQALIRPLTELAAPEALIRHIRLKLIYPLAPRPNQMPEWLKGGGRTSLRGEESPQAVLTWEAVLWLRRMKARDMDLRTSDLAKMVTTRFGLKRVLCDRTIRDAIRGATWGTVAR